MQIQFIPDPPLIFPNCQRVANRKALLDLVPKGGHCVEVGVLEGTFSDVILEVCQPKRLYLVDWWPEATALTLGEYKDDGSWVAKPYNGLDCYRKVLSKFRDREDIVLLRGISYHVMSCLTPKSLDMVYIDGDHSYLGCKRDLAHSYHKVKSGGWIMGHDYCGVLPGVVQAVNEFCHTNKLEINYLTQESPWIASPRGNVKRMVSYNSFAIQVK
jgi:hypothetical protein